MTDHDAVRSVVSEYIEDKPDGYQTTTAFLERELDYSRRDIGLALGHVERLPCGTRVQKSGRHRWLFTASVEVRT